MIELTRLNQEKFYLNPSLIEIIEVTPDTLITITNGKKYYAMESVEEITRKIESYYRRIHAVAGATE
jgi:flagellar protein FlbD